MVMMEKIGAIGPIDNNAYVVWDESGHGVIIDAPSPPEKILAFLEKKAITVDYILLTHGHFDHTLGLDALKETTGAPVVISQADAYMLREEGNGLAGLLPGQLPQQTKTADLEVEDGDLLFFGNGTKIEVLLAPGHTPGDTVYHIGNYLFTGDVLFKGTMGRCDLPGGNYEQLLASLQKLLRYDLSTIVCPGHGPDTVLGEEKLHNPYYNGGTDGDLF